MPIGTGQRRRMGLSPFAVAVLEARLEPATVETLAEMASVAGPVVLSHLLDRGAATRRRAARPRRRPADGDHQLAARSDRHHRRVERHRRAEQARRASARGCARRRFGGRRRASRSTTCCSRRSSRRPSMPAGGGSGRARAQPRRPRRGHGSAVRGAGASARRADMARARIVPLGAARRHRPAPRGA